MPMGIDMIHDGMATERGRDQNLLGELLIDWLLAHRANRRPNDEPTDA